ncbi:MAG: hypothetical protein KGH72_03450 [Candidatus Micrarchaeota archaeon]|nr:hypothetical protein [Candidatus Micrarchaeota archaeon]
MIMLLLSQQAHAYFNATYLNTTVLFNTSTSAHVVETLEIFVSNSSESQYLQDRGAINLSVAGWENALGITLLQQHIYKATISNFTLLPGPLVDTNPKGGYAFMTFSYIAYNVISVQNIAPRRFEYTFNNQAFNFEHAASGQVLPSYARLNILLPKGSEVVNVYPLPDYPSQNFLGNYTNATTFSWYAGEPLSNFAFSYIIQESPTQEVGTYFTQVYDSYGSLIYIGLVILIVVIALYAYVKLFR